MNKKIFQAVATKGLGDRTFRFTISTGDVDREGDRIDPQGWDLTAFKQNPVTLWAHDHRIPPIARTTDIRVVDARLQAVVQFPPPGVHPFADQVHDLLAKGFLSSASVGFRPLRKSFNAERGGWDLEAFKANPVTLWAHDHRIPPIARTTDIGVVADRLQAVVQFPPPGVHPFADQVHDLLAEGFLSSASVGFRPIRKTLNTERGGWDFQEQELLEWSIVGIPALPQAAIERAAVGANRELVTKWCEGRSCDPSDVIMRIGDTGTIEVNPDALRAALRVELTKVRQDIDETVRRTIAQPTMRMTRTQLGRELAEAVRDHLDEEMKEGVHVALGRARGDIDFY